MPRIPEKNPRYRTKSQISADVARILKSKLHHGTKFAVLAEVVWVWSEFEGKYQGCKYWSERALRVRNDSKILVHDHIVPKKIVYDMLFGLGAPSARAVRRILRRFCIGAIITREEDQRLNALGLRSRMPDGWDGRDPWARYRKAGVSTIPAYPGMPRRVPRRAGFARQGA